MAEERDVENLAHQVQERFGVADALVNSAGILQNAVRVIDMDIAEFDRIQAVNVRGTLLAALHFGKSMCARGSGSIINLCSLTGIRPSAQPAYAVGKAGLDMLTQILAAEFGPRPIRQSTRSGRRYPVPLFRHGLRDHRRDLADRLRLARHLGL